jgi:hypothetical protein
VEKDMNPSATPIPASSRPGFARYMKTALPVVFVLAVIGCFAAQTALANRDLPAAGHSEGQAGRTVDANHPLTAGFAVFCVSLANHDVLLESLFLAAFGLTLLGASRFLGRSRKLAPAVPGSADVRRAEVVTFRRTGYVVARVGDRSA